MNAMEILVIILSIFLAIFLLVGIVLVVLLIKVTNQIKRVTESAEKTVNGIGTVVGSVGKYSTPAALAKLVLGQLKKRRK